VSDHDANAIPPDAEAVGVQVLLASGLADAMAAAESTLSSAQLAAQRAFAGLAHLQAVGIQVSAVPQAIRDGPSQDPVDATAGDSVVSGATAPGPKDIPQTGVRGSTPPADVAAPDVVNVRPSAPPWSAAVPASHETGFIAPAAAPVALASFAPATAGADPAPAAADVMSINVAAPRLEAVGLSMPDEGAQVDTPYVAGRLGRGSVVASSPPSRPAAPPQATSGTNGPTGGDVFLDGTRVGIWLADHLAHEASRPQTGGTGFDSRMTAAWPGTLQGG